MKISETPVTEITRLHSEIDGYVRKTLESAIRIGELLTEQKGQLSHGEWLPWVKTNLPFSDRTARRYIQLHEQREQFKLANVSNLSEAYQLLKEDEPEPDVPEEEVDELEERLIDGLAEFIVMMEKCHRVGDQKKYPPEYSSFEECIQARWKKPEEFARLEAIYQHLVTGNMVMAFDLMFERRAEHDPECAKMLAEMRADREARGWQFQPPCSDDGLLGAPVAR